MTSISKYEADFADNVIRAEGVKLLSKKPWTVKRKCHQFALKEKTPCDSSSSAVQLTVGKTVNQEAMLARKVVCRIVAIVTFTTTST